MQTYVQFAYINQWKKIILGPWLYVKQIQPFTLSHANIIGIPA